MDIMGLVFRWLHLVPAVLLAGGILFQRLCLSGTGDSTSLFDRNEIARKRWMQVVAICTLLLLLSSGYNFYIKLITYKLGGLYHGLFGLKLLLGVAIFYLAAVLSGRSHRAKNFRQREVHWLNVLCLLILATILIGGFMKVSSTDATKKALNPTQDNATL